MLEKIKEMVAEQLNVDAAEITEATSFKDDLGADSLDLFELVMALEEEYEIEIVRIFPDSQQDGRDYLITVTDRRG